MDEAKLAAAIKGIVGTRTYIPISESESIIVFERKDYIHVFRGLNSVFGSTSEEAVAHKVIRLMQEANLTYHPLLLEKINGL